MIRVLLADDDALLRAGVAVVLGTAEGIVVVGEAADGLRPVPRVDLREDPLHVRLDRRFGQGEQARDLGVGVPLGHQVQYVALARREVV